MLWVNELPSIRIRGRASARGTSLTFSSRNPRLLVDSSYGLLPQFMMQVQFGLRTCWPTWSRKKQPDLTLSCFRGAAVVPSMALCPSFLLFLTAVDTNLAAYRLR